MPVPRITLLLSELLPLKIPELGTCLVICCNCVGLPLMSCQRSHPLYVIILQRNPGRNAVELIFTLPAHLSQCVQ